MQSSSGGINPLLQQVNELKDNFQYQKALNLLNSIQSFDLKTYEDRLQYYRLQNTLLYELGRYPEVLLNAEELINIASEKKDDLAILDAWLARGATYRQMGKNNQCLKAINQAEKILLHLHDFPKTEVLLRSLKIAEIKAGYYWQIGDQAKLFQWGIKYRDICKQIGSKQDIAKSHNLLAIYYKDTGELTKALENYNPALNFWKEINDQLGIGIAYNNIGTIYSLKGELDLALNYYNEGLTISHKGGFNLLNATLLSNKGDIYFQQGDLEKSLSSLKQGLKCFREMSNTSKIVSILSTMVEIYLDQNDTAAANACLSEIQEFSEQEPENIIIATSYQIAKALILNYSGKTRDIITAENILKTLIKKKNTPTDILTYGLINLCEILFHDLEKTHESEILSEISEIIDQLTDIATRDRSFSLLAQSFFFKAKLVLLHFEFRQSQKLLTQAQQIANKYQLFKLEQTISQDHDRLLESLDIWKKLKQKKAPLSERLELLSLQTDLQVMKKRKEVESVKYQPENPQLLSIITKSGLAIYNYYFSDQWESRHMFSSFMTAFNAFSQEFFSKTLDRIKIGDNTIIMVPLESLSLCYVINGQTYPAQQKLVNFAKIISDTPQIIEVLHDANSKVFTIDNERAKPLNQLVEEFFC